jgi:hypothetical protein
VGSVHLSVQTIPKIGFIDCIGNFFPSLAEVINGTWAVPKCPGPSKSRRYSLVNHVLLLPLWTDDLMIRRVDVVELQKCPGDQWVVYIIIDGNACTNLPVVITDQWLYGNAVFKWYSDTLISDVPISVRIAQTALNNRCLQKMNVSRIDSEIRDVYAKTYLADVLRTSSLLSEITEILDMCRTKLSTGVVSALTLTADELRHRLSRMHACHITELYVIATTIVVSAYKRLLVMPMKATFGKRAPQTHQSKRMNELVSHYTSTLHRLMHTSPVLYSAISNVLKTSDGISVSMVPIDRCRTCGSSKLIEAADGNVQTCETCGRLVPRFIEHISSM